jgi:hypothetical protein
VKGQITDPEFLSSIRSVDVQLYLRSRGWKPIATTMQTEAIDWEFTGVDRSVEVTVPRNARWRDYARRVREVLAELSQLEGRSEHAIAQDIPRASRKPSRARQGDAGAGIRARARRPEALTAYHRMSVAGKGPHAHELAGYRSCVPGVPDPAATGRPAPPHRRALSRPP